MFWVGNDKTAPATVQAAVSAFMPSWTTEDAPEETPADAEAADRLPAVDVERPQRDAREPRDPRQEAGERGAGSVIRDDEAAVDADVH